MNLNPDTLAEEGDWEKLERQRATGVIGSGQYVACYPHLEDPEVEQMQHRAVCLTRPFSACPVCPHNTFTLVFQSQPQDPYELLACPRWRTTKDRLDGKSPDDYIPVERGLCSKRPFDFCNQCPTKDELADLGADKVRPGWYGRWRRILKEYSEKEDMERD